MERRKFIVGAAVAASVPLAVACSRTDRGNATQFQSLPATDKRVDDFMKYYHSKDLIENHCLFDEDHYFIPDYGFKLVDLVIYLNHSETPNVISLNDGEEFEAIRDIASGEELLVDYGTIVESEE
jgi:hypothetical protein